MATIALYKSKVNKMPGLINDIARSVKSYNSELLSVKKKALKVDSSVCDLGNIISSIQTSSQTQERKITSLDNFREKSEEFISDANRIDKEAAETINERKADFYAEYDYLKPECEKSVWEKIKDGCDKVKEWCKEHWRIVSAAVIIAAAAAVMAFISCFSGIVAAILLGVIGIAACVALIAVAVMPSKEEHYARNKYQEGCIPDDPYAIIGSDQWEEQPDSINLYHRHTNGSQGADAVDNKKYMSIDGRMEVIINFTDKENPKIVTDPYNRGTYNFGTNVVTHFFLDVIPYWLWGNGEEDSGWDHMWARITGPAKPKK